MNRSHVARIYPTPEQASALTQIAGACRFVYNLALEQRRDWWRQFRARMGKTICWASQSLELTELRRELEWLAAVPRCTLEQSLRDLDKAFSAFFRGAGMPGFRSARTHRAFRVPGGLCSINALNRKWAHIQLPKVGKIKVRVTRAVPADLVNVTVRQIGDKWVAVLNFEAEATVAGSTSAVGVDRGVANAVSLSNGRHYAAPLNVSRAIAARKRAQRELSRAQKGSKRRAKKRLRAAELYRRVAAVRSHWLHGISTGIVREFGQVAIEKLPVANMTRAGKHKRGLNRSILEQGWSIFANMLAYKLEDRGGTLHLVNPAYTSQMCSDCGSVNAESRKSQAVFHCVDCGHRAHADTNAAINILRRSPAGVEGAGYSPVEARTGAMLTHRENLAA